MRRVTALLLVAVCCGTPTLTQAAEFKGKVTKPDGVTALANVDSTLYIYDPANSVYRWHASTQTDNYGNYKLKAQELGVYLVIFNQNSSGYQGSQFYYPYSSYNYYNYNSNPLLGYYRETYNDVTPLTPTKAPTQLQVTNLASVTTLQLVKLNPVSSSDCLVTGPITINGVPYSYFSQYGYAPKLPDTGGTLNISFKVQNSTSAAISTNVQGLAFLERLDSSYANGDQSIQTFPRKVVNLPAKTTTTVNLAVTVPATLMTTRPLTKYWAFNLGVQMVSTQGVANCSPFLFPVLHASGTSSTQQQELADREEFGPKEKMIPLLLSETGEVLEWGPVPDSK